jgi:hypothetical protein
MKRVVRCLAISALIAAGLPSRLWTQQATGGAGRSAPDDVEPEAMAALNKMGAYLRTLKVFQVRAEVSTEDVLENGQKIQFASVTDLLAHSPDRLRVDVDDDRYERLFLYDGKNFTLYGRRLNYYATVPAPPTIAELASQLEEKFGIELPLVDLFRWGGPGSQVSEIKTATTIGPSQVGGTTCEQYAFRQPGLDWQIWIQRGDYPLPRKLVLTTMTDEARPQHVAVYTWNLAPSYNDATFQFVPPPDARKIVFAGEKPAAGEQKK